MARAMLRDDYWSGRSAFKQGLDDDSRTSVPAGLSPGVPAHVPGSPVESPNRVNPLVTVRQRFQTGYDLDGNPEYGWHTLFTDREAIVFQSRTEASDSSNLTVVKAKVTVLYGPELPALRESASVRTSDGFEWAVTSVDRHPDRLQLELERIEDGD